MYDLIAKGIKTTDVVVVDLTLSQEKAANIVLNNSAIAGEFTNDLQDILDSMDVDLKAELLLTDLEDKTLENFEDTTDGDGFAEGDQFTENEMCTVEMKLKKSDWEVIKADFTSYMSSIDTPFKVR